MKMAKRSREKKVVAIKKIVETLASSVLGDWRMIPNVGCIDGSNLRIHITCKNKLAILGYVLLDGVARWKVVAV